MTWEIKKNNRSLGLVNARTPLMALDKLCQEYLIGNWDNIEDRFNVSVIDDTIVIEEI